MRNTLVWQIQLIQKAICHKLTECLNFTMFFPKLRNLCSFLLENKQETTHCTVKPSPLFSFIKKKINRDIKDITSSWPCKSWQKKIKNTCKMYCKAWATGFLPKLGQVSRVRLMPSVGKCIVKYLLSFNNLWALEEGYILNYILVII